MVGSTQGSSPWITHPWVAEGERRIRFGLAVVGQSAGWSSYFDWVRRTEALGFDSFWVPDHPMRRIDCWMALGAIAARGTSLRLGSFVSCIYYCNPALLARVAADVDCLSDGRLVMGVGIGWDQTEFEQMALALPSIRDRQAALQETIEIVRGMWGASPFTSSSPVAGSA